ncbi:MAG: pyridoxal phosphate-dependent decarboxylase family protein, partial [Candidatus Limnocylindrales bacterium]
RRAIGEPVGYADLRATFFGTDADGQSLGPGPAPASPTTADVVLGEFRERVAPHLLNAYHPAALSYFTPPPLAMSVVGELLAQVAQQGIDVWECGPAGAFVEEEVVRWLTDLVGYPPPNPDGAEDDPFGILTSGGVMANFLAMTLARDIHLPRLTGADAPPRGRALEGIRIYAGDQAHFSIARALDELGFPADTLQLVSSDADFRLRAGPVAEAIAADRAAGLRPLAIAAVAGSTNTGSIDEIPALADLAAAENLWLHVDAAYGGAARLSPRLAGLVPGFERADSVTVDPHKWFFQAYDIGALLVRRRRDLLATFHRSPEYYPEHEDADLPSSDGRQPADGHVPAPTPLHFYQHGMEGTRRWRALKLWLSWKHLGSDGLARLIEATVDTAAYLARRIAESDDFEALPVEPPLSVVCFRHLPDGRTATSDATGAELVALDAHQAALQRELEASGEGWLSTTTLRGRTYLRAGIVNYLTTDADIDALLATLRRLAAEEG